MHTCCENSAADRLALEHRQRRVLHVVLGLNLLMFLAESGAGVVAHSTALLADSLDMLGDALVYGFSLYVLGRGARWQARAAQVKGIVMAAFGAGVVLEAITKLIAGTTPGAELMGIFGFLALVTNVACLALLLRHRRDDLNMRSVWVCSRNDVIANTGVLVAAAAVAVTGSAWPDVLIGLLIAAVFGASALSVLKAASQHLSLAAAMPPGGPQ